MPLLNAFVLLLLSTASAALIDEQRMLITKPRWRDDCWNPTRNWERAKAAKIRENKKVSTGKVSFGQRDKTGFLGVQVKARNPGAGMTKITPFKQVLKDGYTFVKCIKDEMYYHADKFHQQRHAYKMSANVSIVHYDANVPKEDRELMTPEECFKFCRTVPDMLTFGILNGRECYCAPYFNAMASKDSQCDSPCVGDPGQMCGGKAKSSVFGMHLCANMEGDIRDGLTNLKKTSDKLDGETTSMMNMAKQGDKETADLQKDLGIIGDPIASDNFQRAKVQAGVLLHLAEDAAKLVSDMKDIEKAGTEMLESSFLQVAKVPDFSNFDVAIAAEKLIASMTSLADLGDGMLERLRSTLEVQYELATLEGAESAVNRSSLYTDAYYFVQPESMGANWAKDKSTCAGTLVAEPKFALDEDGCAYACDQTRDCTGFNWFAKGSGVCFLFGDVEAVTHYDMCGKPLEGECAPTPQYGKNESSDENASMLQEDHSFASTPFPFKTKSLEPNASLFQGAVAGMCTQVYGCSGSEDPLWDCNLMSTYACKAAIRNAKIDENDGTLTMSFQGQVERGVRDSSCKVNPEQCESCNKYSTCVGPYLETDPVKIKKGDVASYTWTSSGAVDNYEVFVGLYSESCGLVDYQFQRGAKQEWKTFELFAPKTDKYYMKFMLGSYDGSGGGAVGADMEVRDVKQTKASIPRIFEVGAKCKLKFSAYRGTSMAPDRSGKCKHCFKEATKRCLKPDGSFPIPEKFDDASK